MRIKRIGLQTLAALLSALVIASPVLSQTSIFGRNAVPKQFSVINNGTASTDNAYLEAKVQGTGAGDPHLRLTIPGGTSWYVGNDNSDSDGLKIGTGTAVGTNTFVHVTTAGISRFGSVWETPVATTAVTHVMVAGNACGMVRNTTNDVEETFCALSSSGAVGTQTNHRMDITANNGGGQLSVEPDGRVWGNHIHNTGTVTGTTSQYLASGTYTPTLTNTTNVAASTARKCQWIRVGNVVSVSGSADIDPTAAAATLMGISLPIASNLALATDCGGTAAGDQNAAIEAAAVRGDATNDRCEFSYTAVNLANHTIFFHFQYEVL